MGKNNFKRAIALRPTGIRIAVKKNIYFIFRATGELLGLDQIQKCLALVFITFSECAEAGVVNEVVSVDDEL